MFVCFLFGVYRPIRECFTHMEMSPLPGKGCQCWPLLALMAIQPTAGRLAVDLSLPVFTTKVCRGWDSNFQPSACGVNALTHCETAAVIDNINRERLPLILHIPVITETLDCWLNISLSDDWSYACHAKVCLFIGRNQKLLEYNCLLS